MCMEDIRIGRKSIMYRYRFTVNAGTSVQVLKYNPDRVSLLIPSHGNNTSLWADTEQSTGVADAGVNLAYNDLTLEVGKYGQLTTSEWWITNSGANPHSITVWEVVLREQ